MSGGFLKHCAHSLDVAAETLGSELRATKPQRQSKMLRKGSSVSQTIANKKKWVM